MSDENSAIESPGEQASAPPRPLRLHHAAWVTRDQEATRRFYEEVIGIPLIATWIERPAATGREYCHTLYEFEDGSTLAFFHWTHQDDEPFAPQSPGHVAFKCAAATQQAIRDRLQVLDYPLRVTDHGYCLSLYVHDPNNLKLEFTVDHAHAVALNDKQRRLAHEYLARWVAGDRTPNNDLRPD